MSGVGWYLQRLSRMGTAEMFSRTARLLRHTGDRLRFRRPAVLRRPVPATDSGIWLTDLAPWERLRSCAVDRLGWNPTRAEDLLDHRFSFFAFEKEDFGPEIRWNYDYRTRKATPLVFAPGLNYRDERVCGDIKYAWEPNRHLHLVELAKAWYLTGDRRYSGEVARQVDRWIDECPYMYGINWASSLEAALRVINWCFALRFLSRGGERPSELGGAFLRRWTASIHEHCVFIRNNLSAHSSANNHLIGEAAGLLFGALCFRYPESEGWSGVARTILLREAERQVWPDGVGKEQAVAYQSFVFDFLLLSALLAAGAGRPFPKAYWDVLERMAGFVFSILGPDGLPPQIGDDDEGLVVALTGESPARRYRSMIGSAGVLFRRPEFLRAAGGVDEKVFWLLGERAFEESGAGPARPAAQVFPDGGYYTLQSGESRLLFDCGPLGYLTLAAHGHADALSILLEHRGRRFLVDPGTFVYHTQRRWRDYFRGTAAHNTLQVDGLDQSVMGGNFLWTRHARARLLYSSADTVAGEHDGYTRLPDPVFHEREIRLDPGLPGFVVTDRLRARGKHSAVQSFHCDPSCTCTVSGRAAELTSGPARVTILFDEAAREVRLLRGEEDPLAGWYSPGFDRKVPASTLRADVRTEGAVELVTRIITH